MKISARLKRVMKEVQTDLEDLREEIKRKEENGTEVDSFWRGMVLRQEAQLREGEEIKVEIEDIKKTFVTNTGEMYNHCGNSQTHASYGLLRLSWIRCSQSTRSTPSRRKWGWKSGSWGKRTSAYS